MYIVVQQYNLDLKTCDGMAMFLEIYYFLFIESFMFYYIYRDKGSKI